jgi:hypothetical protein
VGRAREKGLETDSPAQGQQLCLPHLRYRGQDRAEEPVCVAAELYRAATLRLFLHRRLSQAVAEEPGTPRVVQAVVWDRWAEAALSCHHLLRSKEREPEAVEGVGWALLAAVVETLWDLLLRAVEAAMVVAEATVVPAEEQAVATP